jgi:cell division protein FtsN
MAGKRNTRSQARRNSGGDSTAIPGGIWMLVGLGLAIALFLFAPKFLDGGSAKDFFRPKPNAEAQPPAIDATSDRAPIAQDAGDGGEAATGTAPEKTQDYDFYTLLSGEETAVSDRELAERARAEDAARRQAERNAADAADLADDARTPPAIDAAPAPEPQPAKPDVVAEAPSRDDARYLLQAGAFQASGDAEALKAKIAFVGLSARVESAQIKGQTVYRVRMGPYGSATELADAKRKLATGGLPAMAIKAK